MQSGQLKWTGMGGFNSDDDYIYYWGQESLRRNEVAIMVNKRVQTLVAAAKESKKTTRRSRAKKAEAAPVAEAPKAEEPVAEEPKAE